MIRVDLSSKLVHLTRSEGKLNASERFGRILSEKVLIGSSQDVRGGFKVVAFTESPISMLASVLANAKLLKMQYAPLGFLIDKTWLYKQGGRPVIYESNPEYDDLPESKQYLHVRYEPHRGVDYSWEREWRIRTDRLPLDPEVTTVIVPTRDWEKNYHALYAQNVQTAGIVTQGLWPVSFPEWHFIALEDLGVSVEKMEPISFNHLRQSFCIKTID